MNMQPNIVPIAYRPPFGSGELYFKELLPGKTILEMVLDVPNLPANFVQSGYVCINGEIVPREMWAFVRPKPSRKEFYVAVTLHTALQNAGSGGAGRKSIVGLVAAIALIAVTSFITGGGAAIFAGVGETGLFAAGSTSAQLLAGAIGITGALAISALTAPPISAQGVDTGGSNSEQAEAASASGNILDKSGAIPRVLGTRKVFPPLACEPVVELVGQDEYVEALFVLNGPHQLDDIRIENNDVSGAEDIQLETREGWPTDTAVTLVTRQGKTITPQLELSKYQLQTDGVTLVDQSTPTNSIPVWHGFASRNEPDEIWVHLLWPGGIYIGSNSLGRTPFRCRIRKKGQASWINIPEFHVSGNSSNQFRGAIVFKFNTTWASPPNPPTMGFDYAHAAVPTQSFSPATPAQWLAHSFFYTGGTANVYNGNLGNVSNIKLYDNRIEVYFDAGQFPAGTFGPGIYEVQVKRGLTVLDGGFNKGTYVYNFGTPQVYDLFWYVTSGGNRITQSQTNFSDRVMVSRLVSIWHQAPLTTPGNFALIAVKARNRSVRQLSTVASGYVPDWNGSSWSTSNYVVTSNPAPHYADVLSGLLNNDPLDSALRGDNILVLWRTLCRQNNWTCDAIINDMRTQDVLTLLASCGYARPYQSDTYKVVIDNDRTQESPVQVFSRRNCANLRFERAFARVPAGLNVTYRNNDLDDDQAQLVVTQRDPANTDMTLLESVTYDGLVTEDKVSDRAQFDLDQANLRSTFYYLDVDIESIVAQRGSLVGVEHDILATRSGDGYIVSKQVSGGNIIGVTLDSEITTVSGTTGIVIRRTDGSLSTHPLSNATGSSNVLTFTTPITDTATIQGFADNDRRYGCMVVAGDLSSIYRRMLVHTISPQKDLTAQMVLVDEAPALVRYPSRKTEFLAHLSGANGGTSFPEATGNHPLTRYGSTTTTTGTSAFGGSSAAFGGGSSFNYGLSADDSSDWTLGDRDFTIDFWFFTFSNTTQQVMCSQGPDNTTNNTILMDSSGHLQFQANPLGFGLSGGSVSNSTWTHVAVERYQDLWTLYQGGSVVNQVSNPIVIPDRDGIFTIGMFLNGSNIVNGRMQEFRKSRVARYQGASFGPPVSAYSVD